MAIATALTLTRAPLGSAQRSDLPLTQTATATAFRLPPRVYSPCGRRRLTRPMAIPRTNADSAPGGPPGRLVWRLFRARRG